MHRSEFSLVAISASRKILNIVASLINCLSIFLQSSILWPSPCNSINGTPHCFVCWEVFTVFSLSADFIQNGFLKKNLLKGMARLKTSETEMQALIKPCNLPQT